MFGTLDYSVRRREPLTFIETTDPVTALNRNQRDKPHVSCELCRKRKIRCDGNASGCDKCRAVSVVCRYPTRESRKKRQTSRAENDSWELQSSTNRSGSSSDGKDSEGAEKRGNANGKEKGKWQCQQSASSGTAHALKSPASRSVNMSDMELDSNCNSGSNVFEGPTESDNSSSQLLTEHQGATNSDSEGTDEAMGGSLFGGSDNSFYNVDDLDAGASFGSFFGSDNLKYSMVPEDISPFVLPPSTSDSNVVSKNLLADPTSQPLDLGVWLNQSITGLEGSSRTSPGQLDRQPNRRVPLTATAAETALPDFNDHSPKYGCRCLHSTARLIERLGTLSASRDPVGNDILLGCLRGALAICTMTLDCTQCSGLSEHNMLLAMAGQYMSAISERIVVSYMKLRRAHEQKKKHSSRSEGLTPSSGLWVTVGGKGFGDEAAHELSDESTTGAGLDEMWFSTYRIETSRERIQVLRCLIMVQLTEFSRVLELIKARAGSRMGHLVPLTEAWRKTKSLRSMLRG